MHLCQEITGRPCGLHRAPIKHVCKLYEDIIYANYSDHEGRLWLNVSKYVMLPADGTAPLDDQDEARIDQAGDSADFYEEAAKKYIEMLYSVEVANDNRPVVERADRPHRQQDSVDP